VVMQPVRGVVQQAGISQEPGRDQPRAEQGAQKGVSRRQARFKKLHVRSIRLWATGNLGPATELLEVLHDGLTTEREMKMALQRKTLMLVCFICGTPNELASDRGR